MRAKQKQADLEAVLLSLHLQVEGHKQYRCPECYKKHCEYWDIFETATEEFRLMLARRKNPDGGEDDE